MDIANLKNDKNIRLITKAAEESDGKIFLVGGALRDIMLGINCRDYDFVLFGELQIFTDRLAKFFKRSPIHIGNAGKEVIRFVKEGATYDFTKAKGCSIKEDISNRDFTINSIAWDPCKEIVIDICGAKSDIDNKIIKIVKDSAFDDDPIRMLRAFRFMAELGFVVERDTLNLIAKKKNLIKETAGERIREELFKILSVKNSYETIREMGNCGLLYEIFPELKDSVGCLQNEYHHFDVMEHVFAAYKNLEDILGNLQDSFPITHKQIDEILLDDLSRALLKYAILLHDVAKPCTKSAGADGRIHFYRHCEIGSEIVKQINARLRLSNKDNIFVANIVRRHLRIVPFLNRIDDNALQKKSILRYFMRLGEIGGHVIVHNLADLMAARGIKRSKESEIKKIAELSDMMLNVYFNEFLVKSANPPLINGDHLIKKFGLAPSPIFKKILSAIYEKQIAGEIKTVEEANRLISAKFININTP